MNLIIEENFEETILLVKSSLICQGFGIVSEIDIQEKLKSKLDVDFKKYLIIGACDPSYALQALKVDENVGTMLPCNIVVKEINQFNTEVVVIDPLVSFAAIVQTDMLGIAKDVKSSLEKALYDLEAV